MSSKIATAILTGGLSLASPTYGKIATLGILGDKSKPKAGGGPSSSSPLASTPTASSVSGPHRVGVVPTTTTPLGDVSEATLSRGRLLGG